MDIWINRPEKVCLTEEQIKEAAKYKLRGMLSGDGIEEYKGGRWVYTWFDTGHGSGMTEYHHEATELDEALVKVLAAL